MGGREGGLGVGEESLPFSFNNVNSIIEWC